MKFLINDASLSTVQKIEVGISYFLQLTIVLAIIIEVFQKRWLQVFLTSGILILTILPALMRRNYAERLPIEIDLIVIFMVYVGVFMGSLHGYYEQYWWWDGMLHAIGGILLGFIGFLLVYILNTQKKVHFSINPIFVVIFSVAFAVLLGVIWEIYEFAIDSWFGFNSQETGLVDTMWDLILDLLGSLLVAISGLIYMRKERNFVKNVIYRFINLKSKRQRRQRRR